MHAATKSYVDGQFTERRLPQVVLSAATALGFAAHNNRLLLANAGTSLGIDYNAVGLGFSCMVVNRSGADLALALSNFTGSAPVSSAATRAVGTPGSAKAPSTRRAPVRRSALRSTRATSSPSSRNGNT